MRNQERTAIAKAAYSWLNTPFLDCQRLKGIGVDCANLPVAVLKEAIGLEVKLPVYSPQVYLHKLGDSTFLDTIMSCCREIEEEIVAMGDFVLYRVAKSYTHGGIVISWPDQVIHPLRNRGVIISHGLNEGFLKNRPHRFFTVF